MKLFIKESDNKNVFKDVTMYTQYDIIVDGDTYDTVEDEAEAIRIAEDLASSEDYVDSQISVETYNVMYDFNGVPVDDLGVTETIWEN